LLARLAAKRPFPFVLSSLEFVDFYSNTKEHVQIKEQLNE